MSDKFITFFVDALSMISVTETTTVQDATSVEEEDVGRMRGHEDWTASSPHLIIFHLKNLFQFQKH